MDNLQIKEDKDVTIEIDIDEMLKKFDNVIIIIKIGDKIIDKGKYQKKEEIIRIK